MDLAEAISQRPVVIDGGLATELERRGHDLSSRLWSAALIASDPDAIVAVHRSFFDAGAEVATAASYQAPPDAVDLLRRSVSIARQAREAHGSGWVAASVGPYGAVLADGSEYRGDYGLSVAELRRFHRPRLAVLADAGADLLAVETLPCLAEVEAVLSELDALDVPAWLSMTCAGVRTRAGEPAADGFAMARDCGTVLAVGVNCVDPADVPALIALAVRQSSKPAVAYPNSGERWDGTGWAGSSRFRAADATDWVAAGARLVGGCCRVGPSEIAAVAGQVGTARPR